MEETKYSTPPSAWQLDKIMHIFLSDNPDERDLDIGLLCGDTGAILLQAAHYDASGDDACLMASESLLDHVLNKIEQETRLSPTFSDGLAGVGITILLLQETTMIDRPDNEFFTDLDRYLGRILDKSLQENDLDPLHGALGIATYFVKRKRADIVTNVILKTS